MNKYIKYDKKISRSIYSLFTITTIIFLSTQIAPIEECTAISTGINTQPTILITGFGPWHIYDENPSGIVATQLNNTTLDEYHIIGIVLPVDFNDSVTQMITAINVHHPTLIISLGLAANAKNIRVETLAVNLQFDSLTTNPLQTIQRINPSGTFFLRSTLDIDSSLTAIRQYTPVIQSYFAGVYICNTVFYQTLQYLKEHNATIPMGFLHVPQTKSTNPDGIELETIIQAVQACISANIKTEM